MITSNPSNPSDFDTILDQLRETYEALPTPHEVLVRCIRCSYDPTKTAAPPVVAQIVERDREASIIVRVPNRILRGRTRGQGVVGGLGLSEVVMDPTPLSGTSWTVTCHVCKATSTFGQRAARRALDAATLNGWGYLLGTVDGLVGPDSQPVPRSGTARP